jgi:hypothetical protein
LATVKRTFCFGVWGTSYFGDLQTSITGADMEGVTVALDADVIAIDRSQVARLYVRRRTKRTVITGLLAGGAAGVLVGLTTAKTNRGTWALMLGSGWAAIGTLIGAIDAFVDAERLVYSASRSCA